MRFEFKKTYDRTTKKLSKEAKLELKEVAMDVVDVVSTGKKPAKGIRLKHLYKDYWEASKGIKERIIFKLSGDLVQFILAGSHDDVKRFLKRS